MPRTSPCAARGCARGWVALPRRHVMPVGRAEAVVHTDADGTRGLRAYSGGGEVPLGDPTEKRSRSIIRTPPAVRMMLPGQASRAQPDRGDRPAARPRPPGGRGEGRATTACRRRDRDGRVQPFVDPDEGVEVSQVDRRYGQRVQFRQELSDVLNGSVLLRRHFHPEGHGSAVDLDRLLHVDQPNSCQVLLGEPTRDADLTSSRFALARAVISVRSPACRAAAVPGSRPAVEVLLRRSPIRPQRTPLSGCDVPVRLLRK